MQFSRPWLIVLLLSWLCGSGCLPTKAANGGLPVPSDQNPKDKPLPAAKALQRIQVPEGFSVTLFAAEPAVRQPIAMTLDDRGRLWVCECFSYPNWKQDKTDRIIILTDKDNDGQFDTRKVFLDQISHLTGIEIGFGGVWITAAPQILFIPDANRDDVPDGPAQVVLDGFATKKINHNVVNGLTWGPDGWLWARHGIQEESLVGPPGTPAEDRTKINCCIFRIQPVTHELDVIAHGTTNPWGLDFNDYGEAFITNCVIGHLFHVIPGARYKRMYGQDYNPHAYQLMDACSDHLHWQAKKWQDARDGDEQSAHGGGHAHCGGMIYLGNNWPAKYRGAVFTCNVHGQRVNQDLLERQGSGYVGRHGKDIFFAHDDWFRGVELKYGPDGGVFITDWTDLGECHDSDGTHRDSGRIYKMTFGQVIPFQNDVAALDWQTLVEWQFHDNDWFVRHARRVLHERAAMGTDLTLAVRFLKSAFASKADVRHRLRALWALHAIEGADLRPWLIGQLADKQEYVRAWSVRLLADTTIDAHTQKSLLTRAEEEDSILVRLYLASALRKIPVGQRWSLATELLSRAADASDQNLPLILWYAVEPMVENALVVGDLTRASKLAQECQIPLVRQFIARRMAAGAR